MPAFFVTGKLGAGKTLACVGRIRDALIQGRPVATNLDLNLHKLVGKQARNVRVYRVPDKPTAADLYALGSGNDTYDEDRNGLLVLDECATWFNAREWNDRGRRELIDWLVHARKFGWDLYFLVQDISAIDKQARKSVAEHVVYCRRMDRLTIPLIDSVAKLFLGKPIPKKKWHLGVVKYGDLPQSLVVDRWWYIGSDLYPAYDTKQVFRDDYPHGLFTYLPPWYTHGRYQTPRNWRYYMRLTRIHFRRYSRVLLMAVAFGTGVATAGYLTPKPEPEIRTVQVPAPAPAVPEVPPEPTPTHPQTQATENTNPVRERFQGMVIKGIALDQNHKPIYVQIGNDQEEWNLDTLRSAGYDVFTPDHCTVQIMSQDRVHRHRVHVTYCPNLDASNQRAARQAHESEGSTAPR